MAESTWFESTYQEEVYDFPVQTTIVLAVPFNSLKESELELLSKILHAVKLSLVAVRIVEEPNLNLSEWSSKPGHVIAFLPPTKGIETYAVIQVHGTSIIFSDPLDKLMGDAAAKQKLWTGLKEMFAK